MNINDFVPNQTFSSTHPYHAWQGDTVIRVFPDESGGTARVTFYRFGTTMVNDTDTLPQQMRAYTKSFVDYGLTQAYYKDGKESAGDRYLISANAAKNQFKSNLVPRDKTGPTYVDVVEPTSGDNTGLI